MRQFTIAGKTITDDSPPYVIAELSHNHNGDLSLAGEMIRQASGCGAQAVKLQKRSPHFYDALRRRGLGDYAAIREARELNGTQYTILRNEAHVLGLASLATAFDEWALGFLLDVGVDAIKLASGAVHNLPLIKAVANANLPILLSTGCADMDAIERAMDILQGSNVALLQCTSAYPCMPWALNLRVIQTYRQRWRETVVGLSSHVLHNRFEVIGHKLGARIFEKHFTLDHNLGEGDHRNSLDPEGLRDMVQHWGVIRYDANEFETVLGDGVKRFLPCEEIGRQRLDMTYSIHSSGR